MATFLLIGPSGSGKSTAAKIISDEADEILVFDLDKEIKDKIGGGSVSEFLRMRGDIIFFEFSRDLIVELSKNDFKTVLIVIGAGSINLKESHEWYLKQNLICLNGEPTILYNRGERQRHHPTFASFINTEFNASRKALYSNSKFKIDITELSPQEVAQSIINAALNQASVS